MSVVHDIITKKCVNCRKEISVLHPDSWAYKRHAGNTYIFWCSWKCLRQSEKEGKINMKKLTLEDKKHAVKIALDGGNPLEYIRMCGVLNAAEAWGKIKNNLKEKDPATWERLPKRLPNPVMDRKKEAPADQVTKEAMKHPEQPVVQIDGPVIIEKMAETPVNEVKPINLKTFSISAIRTGLGEFYFDKKFNTIDWRTIVGDEVSLTPAGWRELINTMPDVLTVLGVTK